MKALDFAMRHPLTIMVAVAAIVLGSVFAVFRMRTDVFPDLNQPIIYVAQAYGGMDPAQMEGFISNYYEYAFLYMSGIDHVETKNMQNLALIKLYFHPGVNLAQAMGEAAIYANRAKAYLPPGTVTPFILPLDASSVPVAFLVLSSETRSINELSDLMLFRIRPILASLPGASAPQPFGGSLRTVIVNLDPDRLRSYNLSPQEVAEALNKGNLITPSGNARINDQMPIVSVNSIVVDPQDLGNIPIKPEQSVYLRDLGTIQDSMDIPTGWALVNGRRSVYMPINKTGDASTLTVTNELKDNLAQMQTQLPEDVKLRLEFDQSPYVTGAVGGVVQESALGALLTGLMVLLFLRDWRSVIVVVLTIPLSLMGSLIGLWLTGQSINLMTLGGLSLAVGILVDEATVVIENIHTWMGKCPSLARSILVGTAETTVPILLAMLCILAVFLPSFLMEGAARGLFVPLAISVGFSMVAAFLLSITFVPVISSWLLKQHPHALAASAANPGLFTFARFRHTYARLVQVLLRWRWTLLAGYAVATLLVLGLAGSRVGREIAPQVDSGQFQMRIRAPSGTRLEVTEDLTRQVLEEIKQLLGPDSVSVSVAYVGTTAPTYTVNSVYLWTSGTDQAVIRIALRPEARLHIEEVQERLRNELPELLRPWLRQRLAAEGAAPDLAEQRSRQVVVSFEPADVINQVMSFGSPTPIEVVTSGPNQADNRSYAEKIAARMREIPTLRDLQFGQAFDYPRIKVEVDRERAGLAGVTVADASTSLIAATSSSRYVVPVFWADPKSGIGYQVQLQVPPARMNSAAELGMIPVKQTAEASVLLRDVARIENSTMPQEYDRINQKRMVTLTANIVGEDLGRATSHIEQAISDAGEAPRGVRVEIRGQVPPMKQMFNGLALGLGLAVIVVFLMLTAYFQSIQLSLVSVATTPAVVAGVAFALFATKTTLNIQSFMGAIMAVGVAVANAILLVTFAERARQTGITAAQAARTGAEERLRPILMTSCAMIAGMVPMALGLGEGGEQSAPLGRAVIGGLGFATLGTLLVLPAVFTVVMGRKRIGSVSLHPDDPESQAFSPETAHFGEQIVEHNPAPGHSAETPATTTGSPEGHSASPPATLNLPVPPAEPEGSPNRPTTPPGDIQELNQGETP
jgi:multidrug efflux pump subunit AcrB